MVHRIKYLKNNFKCKLQTTQTCVIKFFKQNFSKKKKLRQELFSFIFGVALKQLVSACVAAASAWMSSQSGQVPIRLTLMWHLTLCWNTECISGMQTHSKKKQHNPFERRDPKMQTRTEKKKLLYIIQKPHWMFSNRQAAKWSMTGESVEINF